MLANALGMRMKAFILAIAIASVFTAAMQDTLVQWSQIIPQPRQVESSDKIFEFPATITIAAHDEAELGVAASLVSFFSAPGKPASVRDMHGSGDAVIRLSDHASDSSLGDEGYRLTVDASGITIEANDGAGLFYGMQTLEQYAPDGARWPIQFVRITDWPQYRWRGIHLDVSRHFFPVPVVERYIDLAARYKLNTFHWHLTDDQGWRIEIKHYPRLTQIGGCRDGTQTGDSNSTATDGVRYCGYYTQAQIRTVVAYAKARYVTVVPEIEMPGHAVAAVAAYPWLGCDGKPHPVRQLWGVSIEVYCPTERTFAFIDTVLGEVSSLFPGEYIHIGGDEVPSDSWQDSSEVAALMRREHLTNYDAVQGYFTRRVQAIAAKHHKRIVGWNEILAGGVSRSATIMSWQDVQHGVIAAQRGNDVVMTPDGPLYFDAAQGNTDYEPLSIGGLTTLKMVYDFDPMPPGLSPAQARHILGAQGNLWTEYVPTSDHLFYMLLPRELALAELCWTPRAQMNWSNFSARLISALARLDAEGYHYRIPDVTFRFDAANVEIPEQQAVENEVDISSAGDKATVTMYDLLPGASIHYTIDGSPPTNASPVYSGPLTVALTAKQPVTIAAIAVLKSGRASAPAFLQIVQR